MWFFSRMFPIFQKSMMGTSLDNYFGGLPKTGMMHSGNILPLVTSAHPISESGGSVSDINNYPTPNASDGTRGGSMNPKYFGETETGALYRQSEKGVRYGMNLTQYVAYEQISNWGTPNASDAKGTGGIGSKSYQHDVKMAQYLRAQVIQDPPPKPRQLNPDWVELLMGYPIGWTDISSPHQEDKPNMSLNRQELPTEKHTVETA